MCTTAKEHKRLLKVTPHLKTLRGHDNAKRRILKRSYKEQGGKCYWCGDDVYLWWEITPEKFVEVTKWKIATREHLTPKSHGGENGEENIGCACLKCNTERKNISHDQFLWVSSNPERYKKWRKKKAQNKQQRRKVNALKSWFRQARFIEEHILPEYKMISDENRRRLCPE